MARPPLKPGQCKDRDLRIPVTIQQHATVNKAAELAGADNMAAWARPILLREAKRELAKHEGENPDK